MLVYCHISMSLSYNVYSILYDLSDSDASESEGDDIVKKKPKSVES